jgi:hypothetical protein
MQPAGFDIVEVKDGLKYLRNFDWLAFPSVSLFRAVHPEDATSARVVFDNRHPMTVVG